ncbi:MAG: hypothetical protein ACRDJ4_03185 [Actinomycetota bacterium]
MSLDADRPAASPSLAGLSGPLSESHWSADFVMQAIEVLPVELRDGRIISFRPDCADSLIVGWPAGARPEDVAASAMRQLGLDPLVLHSTSWRHGGGEVVLTYLAVIGPSGGPPAEWEAVPVERTELARGGATAPPPSIGVAQVLEHALRHLAWLLKDDAVVSAALPDWAGVLSTYEPEPFRALGEPGG